EDALEGRKPKPRAGEAARPRQGAGNDHPLLVEHAVIRQIDLEPHRRDRALVEHAIGVVKLAVCEPRRADQHGRTAVGGLARKLLDLGPACGLERRLEHEILGRIAGQKQVRQRHKVSAVALSVRARSARLLGVAGDVTHGRIELRNRDRKTVGWARVHGLESDSLRLNRPWSALFALEHDLVGKPLSTFPDHALALTRRYGRPQSVVQMRPRRSATARIQARPAMTSDRPTAAEPISLTRPICRSISRLTRSDSFSTAVLSSSTTSTKRRTPMSRYRFQGSAVTTNATGTPTRKTATSWRNAASLRAAWIRPCQLLMVARSSRRIGFSSRPGRPNLPVRRSESSGVMSYPLVGAEQRIGPELERTGRRHCFTFTNPKMTETATRAISQMRKCPSRSRRCDSSYGHADRARPRRRRAQ